MICLKQDCAKMAKRDVGSSLRVQRCMQCGVGGNKKLVRQLRKPQTIKEGKRKRIHPRSVQTCGTCRTSRKNLLNSSEQKAYRWEWPQPKGVSRSAKYVGCMVYGTRLDCLLPSHSLIHVNPWFLVAMQSYMASIHVFHVTTPAPGPILPKGVYQPNALDGVAY